MTRSNLQNVSARLLWRLLPMIILTPGLFAQPVLAKAEEKRAEDLDPWARIRMGPAHFTPLETIILVGIVLLGLEVLGWIASQIGVWMNSKPIPVRGRHLDELSARDKLFIGISKAQTGPFVYFFFRYCFAESNILWKLEEVSMKTILLPLPVIFIVFDFFYTILHWFLHIKVIYGYVHKHHHTQKAPSRGTHDSINVHPLEFVLGEYNHLLSLFLCCRVFNLQIHVLGTLLFLGMGGILASLNHTRFDITVPVLGINIFDTKAHDVHHRIPQSNYGQFTMFWDYVFGTYRRYDPKDRVNPKAQLDPNTGKSLEYYAMKKGQ